jgi:hypothetical protein
MSNESDDESTKVKDAMATLLAVFSVMPVSKVADLIVAISMSVSLGNRSVAMHSRTGTNSRIPEAFMLDGVPDMEVFGLLGHIVMTLPVERMGSSMAKLKNSYTKQIDGASSLLNWTEGSARTVSDERKKELKKVKAVLKETEEDHSLLLADVMRCAPMRFKEVESAKKVMDLFMSIPLFKKMHGFLSAPLGDARKKYGDTLKTAVTLFFVSNLTFLMMWSYYKNWKYVHEGLVVWTIVSVSYAVWVILLLMLGPRFMIFIAAFGSGGIVLLAYERVRYLRLTDNSCDLTASELKAVEVTTARASASPEEESDSATISKETSVLPVGRGRGRSDSSTWSRNMSVRAPRSMSSAVSYGGTRSFGEAASVGKSISSAGSTAVGRTVARERAGIKLPVVKSAKRTKSSAAKALNTATSFGQMDAANVSDLKMPALNPIESDKESPIPKTISTGIKRVEQAVIEDDNNVTMQGVPMDDVAVISNTASATGTSADGDWITESSKKSKRNRKNKKTL